MDKMVVPVDLLSIAELLAETCDGPLSEVRVIPARTLNTLISVYLSMTIESILLDT